MDTDDGRKQGDTLQTNDDGDKPVAVKQRSETNQLNSKEEANDLNSDKELIKEEHEQCFDRDLYDEIVEGKARVLFSKSGGVFYNPVQEFNRDLSIAVTKRYLSSRCDIASAAASEGGPASVRILDALSASGLRALRYAKEIPNITHVTANDISKSAVVAIEQNVAHNGLQGIISSSHNDASLLMYNARSNAELQYDVIDLDPYGSPAEFLDPSIQAVKNGGLLCVTCTDMAGLCGNHGEASYAKYGVMPLRGKHCHEMALRCVLASLDAHAARYKKYIVPLLSLSIDFYIRMFVKVFKSPSVVKHSASKKSLVYQCIGCDSFHFQPVGKVHQSGNSVKYTPGTGPVVDSTCAECGKVFHVGGPIWNGQLHDFEFVKGLCDSIQKNPDDFKTNQRLIGMLSVVGEELPDCPLYHIPDRLANILKCSTPSLLQMRSAVMRLGYKVSISHANSSALKTNAPVSVIWDIMRCWEKKHPIKREKLKENSPAAAILKKEATVDASFEILPDANPKSRQQKLLRFQENPTENWGPKARAHGGNTKGIDEKRKEHQGKRTHRAQDDSYHKQYPCKRFKANECDLGDACRYSHDIDQSSPNNASDAGHEDDTL